MAGANNDPFEEFEFRPINEGLGFHSKQKPTSTLAESPKAAVAKSSVSSSMNSTVSFQSPLPRPETRQETKRVPSFQVPTIEDDSISKAQTAVNEILKNLNQKRQLDFVQETAKQKAEYKKSKPQFFAAILDGMLITAAFLLSLILMLTITKVDLFMNLSHPQSSQMIYLSTFALFLTVIFIYMVTHRAFAGYTPGEWAFDQICGKQNQADELSYIPKIVFRTILVVATGFIVLPLLSYLFNKDIAGEISGVTLYKKPNAA
jgi:hypothetical protein